MGKRKVATARGGALNQNSLLRHIEPCLVHSPTVDEIVDFLQSTYPHYSRQKVQPLTKQVQKTLALINSKTPKRPKTFIYDDNDENPDIDLEYSTCYKKEKKKNSYFGEKRLQVMEDEHLAKKRAENEALASTTDEESSYETYESGSEDDIYEEEEQVPPKIDLTKDILREKYFDKMGSGMKDKFKDGSDLAEVNTIDVSKKIEILDRPKGGVELTSKKKDEKYPMFKDLGGMNEVIEGLIMDFMVPLFHPQLPRHLGVKPMGGILLNGPPGCGKTKLAHAIANEAGVPFYPISATELVSGLAGVSEENIRRLFFKAYRTSPSIVFIDEIDAIASKRENMQRELERRLVTQLMTSMDELHKPVQPSGINALSEDTSSQCGYILVIGATNKPDSIDPALRRPGRFDCEITLGVPNEAARVDILSKLSNELKLEGAFDLEKIAKSTPGFVGADLAALTSKAGNLTMKRLFDQRKSHILTVAGEHAEDWWRQPLSDEEMGKFSITMADFEEAVKLVQPSSRREGFSAIPNTKWEDVGGLDMLRLQFDTHIVQRIKNPKLYADFGISAEIGFLLFGPPGCGKTLIAKAVANEAGANFIHIKGPELLNKYVGESELAVRTVFSRARTCSPCVLFFDEVDALAPERGRELGAHYMERLVNQLLLEFDGAENRKGVFVVGATNRPDIVDPAFLRPGRFGKLLYVPLPTPDERGMILKALARKKPIDANVDLVAIAKDNACENLSGADLSALLSEAAMAAVQEEQTSGDSSIRSPRTIKDRHFKAALNKIAPSVSDEHRQHYALLSQEYGRC